MLRKGDEEITYVVVDDALALLWVVNLGCIDLNPWHAHAATPADADYVLFDLDPAEGLPFDAVIETALLIRDGARGGRAARLRQDVRLARHPRAGPDAARAARVRAPVRPGHGAADRGPPARPRHRRDRDRPPRASHVHRREPERLRQDDRQRLLRQAGAGGHGLDAAALGRGRGGLRPHAVDDRRGRRTCRGRGRPVRLVSSRTARISAPRSSGWAPHEAPRRRRGAASSRSPSPGAARSPPRRLRRRRPRGSSPAPTAPGSGLSVDFVGYDATKRAIQAALGADRYKWSVGIVSVVNRTNDLLPDAGAVGDRAGRSSGHAGARPADPAWRARSCPSRIRDRTSRWRARSPRYVLFPGRTDEIRRVRMRVGERLPVELRAEEPTR